MIPPWQRDVLKTLNAAIFLLTFYVNAKQVIKETVKFNV